jgi:hypothetical protein
MERKLSVVADWSFCPDMFPEWLRVRTACVPAEKWAIVFTECIDGDITIAYLMQPLLLGAGRCLFEAYLVRHLAMSHTFWAYLAFELFIFHMSIYRLTVKINSLLPHPTELTIMMMR